MKKSHNYWITTVKSDGSPHTMVVWGLWQDGRFLFSTGSKSRKARNLEKNPNCIVCNEHAHEAIIVEGTAEIADVAARRKMLPLYERKYKFDLSTMKDDILSMKELVFAGDRGMITKTRIADLRKLMGATNPANAEEGTIRKKWATNIEFNAIHGSDAEDTARFELSFFFAGYELAK